MLQMQCTAMDQIRWGKVELYCVYVIKFAHTKVAYKMLFIQI